jgi:hypothetical protein
MRLAALIFLVTLGIVAIMTSLYIARNATKRADRELQFASYVAATLITLDFAVVAFS